jgi:hypothetical protein
VFPLIQTQKLSESELIDESESNLVTRVFGQKYLLSSTNKYDLTQWYICEQTSDFYKQNQTLETTLVTSTSTLVTSTSK